MTAETGLHYCGAQQVHVRRFDGETVLVDLARGEYFSLDEVGGDIWDGLAQGLSLAEVVMKLATSYDADPETIRRDAERLTAELVAAGLLVAVSRP